MAIIKCKMCGGDIVLNEKKTFGTCEYCGSVMTLPKVSDEQRAARFNRGNHFRRQGEFDKALAVYESIVREDDTDAEAHWCCALCRFGIEYVEDPNTYEYLPTCHRASFDTFLEDVDYLAALEHSDGITRRQYQKDAAKIAEVQRGILATSQNEDPFDVFICYKETDDQTKERTRDSLDAQDIYYQLTQAGYRVFFSRITLEDKAGTEYEPFIFAALNSAKVMVAIGSKPEYFNAVWVKNEWSRFLAMMRKDRSKLLLPCYKNMDPYDLPEQLGVLQSYDMAKIGFIQDLIRGVKKVLDATIKIEPTRTPDVYLHNTNPSKELVKRIRIFANGADWNRVDELCEKVFNLDTDCVEAYFYSVIAGYHLNKNTAAYASMLSKLYLSLSQDDFAFITKENAVDIFLAFASRNVLPLCEHIIKTYPEVGTMPRIINEIYHSSILSYCVAEDFSLKIIELLLKNGSSADSYRIYENDYGKTKYSALSDAIWNTKNINTASMLLEHGANPNTLEAVVYDDGTSGTESMLSSAIIENGSEEMVHLLLKHGADPNVCRVYRNSFGESSLCPLGDAIRIANNLQIAKRLLEFGADPNRLETIITDSGIKVIKSMLTSAIVDMNSETMVRQLFRCGARLNNVITYQFITRVERIYPYHKLDGIEPGVLQALRDNGWRGNWLI